MTVTLNIEDIFQVIQMIRDGADVKYKFFFEEAHDLEKQCIETTIKAPRIIELHVRKFNLVSKCSLNPNSSLLLQVNINNIPASSVYEYFKLNTFIPYLTIF